MNVYAILEVPVVDAESVSAELAELPGFLGIEELPLAGGVCFPNEVRFDEADKFADWLRAEKFRTSDRVRLKVYLQASADLNGFSVIETGEVKDEDYLAQYRAQHHGRNVGQTLWIGPSWEKPAPGRTPIIIDPGMSFGTGDHVTTQMCLEALERLKTKPHRVLDIGTGSGVLAIAAAKLFPGCELWLTDADAQCVTDVTQNFQLNGLPAPAHMTWSRELPAQEFDLVISNLYVEALKSVAKDVRCRTWIVSGLLAGEQEADFAPTGFTVSRREQHEQWVCLELRAATKERARAGQA